MRGFFRLLLEEATCPAITSDVRHTMVDVFADDSKQTVGRN